MSKDLELLRELGQLRDACVEEIAWRKADRSLRLTVEDMFSHFDGSSAYPGRTPGTVTLVGVDSATIETGVFKGLFRISGLEVEARHDGFDVRIGLRACAELRLHCRDLEITIAGRR